jgi:hypothetical protein
MRRHSAHVDPGVLAELSAGLIGGRRAARIHAHLAGCQRCAGVTARLSAVSVLLAAVPSPAMPESVTRRLSSALADEAAALARPAGRASFSHHSERSGGVPSGASRRGPGLGARRGLTRLSGPVAARAFAAAAAACVLAAGGYTVMQLTTHGPAISSRSPRRAGAVILRNPPKGGLIPPQPYRTPSAPPGTVLPKFAVVQSGTDYQAAHLAGQIESELARVARGSASSGGPEHLSTTMQEDCVYRVTGGNRPTLVDDARYDGQPATVIAMAPSATQLGQAWIEGPGCSAEANDTLTHVELSQAGG